jgi:hypothetical protein
VALIIPRVWPEELYATIQASQIRDGDVAVCLNSTSTPTMKVYRGGVWYLAADEGVAVTVSLDVELIALIDALSGLSISVAEADGVRTVSLNYADGVHGSKTLVTHSTDA